MSNATYLSLARDQRTYPCIQEADFDPAEQTVATAVYAVPLLWLAMFRPDDLQTDAITVDGSPLQDAAPIVARKSITKRLRESAKRLRTVVGRLDAHVDMLVEAIQSVDAAYRYVTIEWLEVSQMNDPVLFHAQVVQALRFFAGEAIDDPKALFAELCNLQQLPRYTPTELWELEEGDPDQEATLEALLGSAHYRAVPWQPGPPVIPPFVAAVTAGDLAAVRDLLANGADPNALGPPQYDMPLAAAIKLRDSNMVGVLIAAGADVNHPQCLPLYVAATAGEASLIRQLLDAGAKVDYAALRVAIESENLALVQLFVESGIDLNPSHRKVLGSDQPLVAAQQIDIVRYLVERGADVNHPSKPLSAAATAGALPKLLYLLERGADPHARDRNGITPLACAARGGHRACVEHLLTLSPKPEDIQTAIREAQLFGQGEILALLRSMG